MKKIPTAVEFIHTLTGEPDDNTIFVAMIEFAKLHVEAALEKANDKVIYNDDLQSDIVHGRVHMKDVYKLSKIN